jgi:DNA-binding transcriptional regulator YiaG
VYVTGKTVAKGGYRTRVRKITTDLEQLIARIAGHLPEVERGEAANIISELHEVAFGTITSAQFKELRTTAGLSQEALARLSGRTLRQIARYEAGTTAIPNDVANLLLEVQKKTLESESSASDG